jgi:hypothetical protein
MAVTLVSPGTGIFGHHEVEQMVADLSVESTNALADEALTTNTANSCGCKTIKNEIETWLWVDSWKKQIVLTN